MNKAILYACGVTNALFVVFHLLLGWSLNTRHTPSLAPTFRALLQAFNVSGTLMFMFLAVAFLACHSDLRSRLGRATILLGALVYLTRAFGEFIFFPSGSWIVVILCTIAGLLHLAALRPAQPAA
jgi:hypothetical protein